MVVVVAIVDNEGGSSGVVTAVVVSTVSHDPSVSSCQYVLVSDCGGTDEETSWLIATELRHATELVTDYHKAYPNKPGPIGDLSC